MESILLSILAIVILGTSYNIYIRYEQNEKKKKGPSTEDKEMRQDLKEFINQVVPEYKNNKMVLAYFEKETQQIIRTKIIFSTYVILYTNKSKKIKMISLDLYNLENSTIQEINLETLEFLDIKYKTNKIIIKMKLMEYKKKVIFIVDPNFITIKKDLIYRYMQVEDYNDFKNYLLSNNICNIKKTKQN